MFIESESKGTSTNVYGFYSIKLSSGNHDVKFSYIGFKDFVKTIQLDDHKRVNVELIESEDLLKK